MQLIPRVYSVFFLLLAIWFIHQVDFNATLLMACVVIPFIALSMVYEWKSPLVKAGLKEGELKTDITSLLVVLVLTMGQNYLVHRYIFTALNQGDGLSFFFNSPVAIRQLPFWAECTIAFLVYDFFFYWMHRIAHTVDPMWRLHAAHHSADKVNYLNSNRIHPLDMIIRRIVPLVALLALGISEKAFIFVGVLINILGPVSHFNINLKHGYLNYLIGTNEVHVWHHSVKLEEAKNYGITMLWDHLFGTFYYPSDRRAPDRIGLVDESAYPTQSYVGQLLQPFRSTRQSQD